MDAKIETLLLDIKKIAMKLENGKAMVKNPRLPGFQMPVYDKEDAEHLAGKINGLCEEYLKMAPEGRKQVMSFLREMKSEEKSKSIFYLLPYFLYDYIKNCAAKIKNNTDLHYLHLGLVAAAIEGGGMDFRDLFRSLGELYLRAEAVGIDPVPHFQSIARLSDEKGEKLIECFHESAYLKEIHRS